MPLAMGLLGRSFNCSSVYGVSLTNQNQNENKVQMQFISYCYCWAMVGPCSIHFRKFPSMGVQNKMHISNKHQQSMCDFSLGNCEEICERTPRSQITTCTDSDTTHRSTDREAGSRLVIVMAGREQAIAGRGT